MYGHRRSVRLQAYDYAQAGAYFITLCTGAGSCLFGRIADGEMHLSPAGAMVQQTWDEIPNVYRGVEIDAFVVMPNHVHGIIVLGDAPDVSERLALPDVVQRFKSLTTARYRHGVMEQDWPRFTKTLWQRNYYEHVIRNEAELTRVREYIVQNPLRWHLDRENPDRVRHLR